MFDIDKLVEDTKDLTLLYIEDNEDSRESTLLILEDIFDNIIVAVDGEDGLDKFQNNKVDLILTDINMPNMDGLEMSKAIKQIDYDTPIIILTALTNISTIKEAIDIGVDSFINKPIEDIDILFNKLDQIIQKINYKKNQKDADTITQQVDKLSHILE
ncbi:MAG: response regulator [Patescibacteria group bacterium]|nr:response regulator [Patescibacteria group bacterium]